MTLSAIEIREQPEQRTVVVRHRISVQEVDRIPGWIGQTMEAIERAGQHPAGMPFLRTFSYSEEAMDIEVGWPVQAPFAGDGEIVAGTLPAGPAAVASSFGPYEGVETAYAAITAWCAEHGHEIAGPPWESYFTDPAQEPDPAKWRTDVHFPVRPAATAG
jgi:effector-binding domain-containing protein